VSQTSADLIGPARIALNAALSSIHDEAAARQLGFRGSAVAGSVHLDVFAPLLVETYGPAWCERGALSLYFENVVVSGEAVQALIEPPPRPGAQVRVRARRADDHDFLVCAGTASLGDHSGSEIARRDLRICDDGRLRMLKGVKPGQKLGKEEGVITRQSQEAQIESGVINEAMDWHRRKSPWGGPIATVSSSAALMFRLLTGAGHEHRHQRIAPTIGEAAGMFGAFEIAYTDGPIFLDRPYQVEGIAVAVGESPKTEYLWWDAIARDEKGVPRARLRHLLRFLKASSPLYPELQG